MSPAPERYCAGDGDAVKTDSEAPQRWLAAVLDIHEPIALDTGLDEKYAQQVLANLTTDDFLDHLDETSYRIRKCGRRGVMVGYAFGVGFAQPLASRVAAMRGMRGRS